ncbi:sensor histidine kinase [Gloeobacter morelensis]|uniref:histidine kinase n=1 Tax=Gloeobacter morelensis MG652769 TaxID=2781736 RepID=A0ABY3PQI4_9CYAN|nr:PAS domain-containing sensor histidine kinase [Gloeobacter morelensis]UFP95910.1 PAS domain-containing sensor histidine kinase [Gloeobacter morelensis MG652769]
MRRHGPDGHFVRNYAQPKQSRTLRLTETAWAALVELARQRGISTSELIEQWARGQFAFPSGPIGDDGEARPVGVGTALAVRPCDEQAEGEQVSKILESITDAFFALDEHWCFTYLNRQAERLLSRSREELIGKNIWVEFPEALGTTFYREYHRAVERQVRVGFEEFYAPLDIWLAVRAYPTAKGLAVYFLDIAERKRAEQALLASEQNFRFLADTIPQMVWTTRPDGYHDFFNRRWFEYTGMNLEQTQGWGWSHLLHPHDLEKCLHLWKYSLATGEPYDIEYRFRRAADGVYRWQLGRALPLRDPQGNILRWFGTCTDIDDQKRAEQERTHLLERERQARAEAEAANRAKDEFLAMLSHELRTPLNPIIGWTQMLRRGNLTPEMQAKALETIERNGKLQNQLIEDLLDISRIIRGKFSISPKPIALPPVVHSAIEAVRNLADLKEVRLDCRCEPSALSRQVSADPTRLQQVIWNLLTNAIKFTPKGGRVEVDLAGDSANLYVAVRDNGMGIAPEFLPYMFERFRQADSRSTRKEGGLGLGLFIVRHIVELHGGMVQAESAGEGKGATFTVELPALGG